MNENLRRIEKAIKQVKKIKPDNDIEVKYVNQIKTLLYNLQRHIEDDYRKLLEDNPLPDDKGNWREVGEYKPGQKDSGEYRKHVLDEIKKHNTIELSDTKMLVRKGTTGSRRECEWSSKTIPNNEYEPEPTLMPTQPKEMTTDDEPPDDAICTREVHACRVCRHFKSVDAPLVGLCSKHDKSVGNDETCDDFVYKLLSERIADGTVGCKCNTCGRIFQKKDGYVAMKGDKVQSFLCEQCYETAYKRQFGRKEIEDRFKPCPICNGKIMFNTTKDILESQYQHIECSKCGFSWKCSPTLDYDDKLVEYINHSIDVVNDGKPKEVKP